VETRRYATFLLGHFSLVGLEVDLLLLAADLLQAADLFLLAASITFIGRWGPWGIQILVVTNAPLVVTMTRSNRNLGVSKEFINETGWESYII
jgi:hypothetical protein